MKITIPYCIALCLFFTFSACNETPERKLPIMGHRSVNVVEAGAQTRNDTVYHTIPSFRFVNQDSLWVTNETFKDKIYVADFFFTSCPTICPIMKTQMLRVYEKFRDNADVAFLSHTIDPEYDTVSVLNAFAKKLGVESSRWHFVTGNKEDIYTIGEKSYLVTAQEDQAEPGGFLHSGAFILVDKDRRIRGFYDGTKQEEVDRLIRDIPVLLKEYNKIKEE